MNGEKLRELREAKGITAAGMDEYLGVPRGTCVSWENGFSEPEEELIEDIAGYFRVSVKELTKPAVNEKETGEEKRTMAEKKNFTDEQKAEILKRAEETSVAAASREFNVSKVTIFRWRSATEEGAADKKPKAEAEKAPARKNTKKAKAEKPATEKATAEAASKKTTKEPKAEKPAAEKAAAPKKTTRKPKKEKSAAEKAAAPKKTTQKQKAEKPAAEKAAAPKKSTQKPKTEKAAAPKKTTKKPKAEKAPEEMQIIVQTPFGHEITPEDIIAKVPEGTEKLYIRIDQNKIYWVKGEERGDVDIW